MVCIFYGEKRGLSMITLRIEIFDLDTGFLEGFDLLHAVFAPSVASQPPTQKPGDFRKSNFLKSLYKSTIHCNIQLRSCILRDLLP